MDKFLSGWTPSPESTHAALRVPSDAGPVDFRLRITPGALEPNKQTVLLTAVMDGWSLRPRDWELWQLKVFAAHGKAVVEMDGRGPKRREVEPLKSRLRWDGRSLQVSALNDVGRAEAYDVAVTFDATTGALSILRTSESLTGVTHLKTTEPWTLLVGKPPSFIDDLAQPAGWRFDLAWEIPGRGTPPIGPPAEPPVNPPPAGRTDIEQIETSLSLIEDEVNAARRVLRRMKGGA